MDTLAMSFTSGWASGVNSYLVVLLLGIAQRLGVDGVPEVLGRWEVLATAGFLYAFEFVADKVPYVDSAWDTISTAIRPTAGAVVAVLLSGDADSLDQAVSGVVGGGTALASHAVKAGTRLAVNSSPEPVTNITLSVVEDLVVLAVVAFAIAYPVAAAVIAGTLLLLGFVALWLALRLVRAGWRRFRARRERRRTPVGAEPWT